MSVVLYLSASQAQDYSHDCDQQGHENQTTDNWQEGSTQHPFVVTQKQVV